ncbi:MAG TPA: peptidase, partial [Accumulibacter sp.]|nr:peptidase [Accumulibacter sp.]
MQRIRLRTAILLGALVSACGLSTAAVHTTEKNKGKTESVKAKTAPVAHKNAAPRSAEKHKPEPLARKNLTPQVTAKNKTEPVAA